MFQLGPRWSVFVAVCLIVLGGKASAETMDDMCSVPKMKTDKWQPRTGPGGMALLTPPGYSAGGMSGRAEMQDSHFFFSGEHRLIGIGSGPGPMFIMQNRDVSENGECETEIAGRRVLITVYTWVVEDNRLSASGNAGAHFAAVARFYPTATQREVFIMFESNVTSEVRSYRQMFWTASFDGAPGQPTAPSTTAGASPAAATSTVATASSAAPCVAPPQPGLPTPDAVLDSATVQSLLASAAPIPHGFEVMALQFDGSGELAGMSVAQSDLPEPSQREISTVVATNLKQLRDAHAPVSFLLRIDAGDHGLHYTVLPTSGCAQ